MNDRHLEELLAPLPENLARRFAKQSRIAIYGVGTMAWYMAKVLEQQQYRIIGFLDRDSVNIGKPFLDYTVIPLEAARDADAILIAAGQHYWEIIYRRIHDFCAQYGIPALYSDGSPAHLQNTDVEHPYWQVTLTQLEAASAGCEVISLDVFDTLLARKTSSPEDIFAIVASQASVCGYPGNFSLERKQAEALCQQKYGDIYTFADIYREWQKNFSVDDTWVARIQTLELETEARFLVPRKTLCNQVLQWLEAGRRVILVSDMYLPSPWILEQLRRHGLTGFEKLFLSCEEGGSKQSGQLWQRVRQYAGQATILHIGDNPEADIEQAKKAGIAAFHCMSEARMLQESALREIAAQATSLGDRIALGLIQDRLMNDPFCMAGSKGKPTLVHPEDFGYVVFGPLIQTFWTWFLDRIRADAIDKILFLARDGWFFHKLYQELRAVCPELPEGVYLPASRRLCLVATFFTAEDVFLSLNDPYFGRQDVFFRMRLGLEYQGNDPEKIIVFEEGRSLAEKHMPEILENARQERNAYVRYLSGVLPKKGKRCALYDFGVRGTIQKCLQKLCDRSFIGYYFYYDDADNNHSMKSHAVYLRSREDGFYEMEKINLLFEAIFTAPEGGYLYATEEGSFVTDDAYANYAHIADISRVHEGIRVFMAEHQASSSPPPPPTKSFSLACLSASKTRLTIVESLKKFCRTESPYNGQVSFPCLL